MLNMNNRIILKSVKQGLKIALVTTLLATTLTSCNPLQKNYISQNEINSISSVIDCDLSYMSKEYNNYLRMKHNEGEPIYVCFDDKYSDELKKQAIESLDYIFGIVGKINSNYKYEIVDRDDFFQKGNKTKIFYTFGTYFSTYKEYVSESNAHLEQHHAWYNFATDNPVYYYYELNLNKERLEGRSEEEILYSFNHELLHAFGFNDVYTNLFNKTTDKYYGNTYMNNRIKYDMLTPNDLKCLISLYVEEDYDIEEIQSNIEKYQKKFYKYYANLCKQKFCTSESLKETSFNFSSMIIAEELDKTRYGYNYKVVVDEERYLFEIYDMYSGKLLDRCEGEVLNVNGAIVLKDVELKKGLKPNNSIDNYDGGFIQDFIFLSKNNEVVLYNYFDNFSFKGTIDINEKSLTQ